MLSDTELDINFDMLENPNYDWANTKNLINLRFEKGVRLMNYVKERSFVFYMGIARLFLSLDTLLYRILSRQHRRAQRMRINSRTTRPYTWAKT